MCWEAEDWAWQAAAESLGPSEDFLLDHLEKSFGVDRADFDLCLQSSHLVGPRHRFSCQSIGPELHETFIDCVEEAFVLNVYALPHQLSLLARVGSFPCNHSLFTGLLYFQVEVHWNDRVLR